MLSLYVNTFVKFFFLLTPFFLLSSFLSMTKEMEGDKKRKIALKSTLSVIIICMVLFFIGNQIFAVFGITLNSFRIGTGILLLISAANLVLGPKSEQVQDLTSEIAVVPLAIPIAVGPATTGALLVMGGELTRAADIAVAIAAIVTSIVCVGLFMFLGGVIERVVKKQGLTILSKVTGLILAALASQMIMTGVMGFLGTR
jgi:multiple antibiotic resistance protein